MTKIRGINTRRTLWSEEQIALLKQQYSNTPTFEIAERLGITIKCIYAKAEYLGLKKSKAYLQSEAAHRIRRGDTTGIAGRFKPGHQTWNKGMKGLQIGGEATQFKPGNRTGKAVEMYQPIGAERISKDGYLQRKINDDMPLQKRWRGVHILLWEAENGPLPPGHAITFRDGNKRHITLNNLELISRAELMRRNSYHRYGKEIASLVQLRGALTRQINRRNQHV